MTSEDAIIIAEAVTRALPRIAVQIRNVLVLKSPFDTGNLRANIVVDVTSQGIIITMPDYGKFVEFGSLPHVIRPVNKKALKWKSGGKDVFAKRVNHPGVRPNPFIRSSLHQFLPKIIVDAIKEEL